MQWCELRVAMAATTKQSPPSSSHLPLEKGAGNGAHLAIEQAVRRNSEPTRATVVLHG
jgi:hypothetical protein